MSSIKFTFENPWFLLLLLPAIAVVLFPFFLLPKSRRKTAKRLVPLGIHIVLVLLLTLVIAGFRIINQSGKQAVVLLLDMSGSTESVQTEIEAHATVLLSKLPKDTAVSAVAFGADSLDALSFTAKGRKMEIPVVDSGASDLASAMEYAVSIAPADRSLRLVLLTDGKQTDGDADSTAYKLATRGVRVDAIYYDTTVISGTEVQISSFMGPEGAYKDKKAILQADIKANKVCKSKLTVYDGNIVVYEKDCELVKGSNLFEIEVTCDSVGARSYRLVLTPAEDTQKKNNEAVCCVNVAGKGEILVIGDTFEHTQMVKTMLDGTNEVTCVSVKGVPKTLVELCQYDGVVMANVQYYDLPYNFDQLLQSYVSDYGRGLFMVGGKGSFMFGGMQDTGIEELLPVELMLEENIEGQKVALMLVLDCSGSMQGQNISVAKQGAIKCLDAMSENDYVGVIAFEQKAHLSSPLLAADDTNKQILSRVISELRVGSGTYYYDALTLACEELRKSDAEIKHIMFLSDGQPSDSGYYDVVREASEDGITVSTIGLGFSSSVLSSIANYGKGRYYPVVSEEDLPNVMLSETEQARANPLIIRDTALVIAEKSEVTDFMGSSAFPNLGGYLGTTLKTKATAYLTTVEGHPLYAAWDYGFGRVSCFTSDLHGEWSALWQQSDNCAILVSNIVQDTVNSVPYHSSLRLQVQGGGKQAIVTVQTASTTGENLVSLVVGQGESAKTYYMYQVYPGTYQVSVENTGIAPVDIMVLETTVTGAVVDRYQAQISLPYSLEYDLFAKSGKALLMSVCSHMEGSVTGDLSALSKIKMPRVINVHDPVVLFAILCGILLLVDIAVRKLRWKDIKECYERIKSKWNRKGAKK